MINTLYKFDGELTAISPLAVNRPGDNFVSPRGSEQLRRLPRAGIKQDNSPVYFPATTLRRLLRESAYHVVREAVQLIHPGPPFSLDTHMMLASGIDATNRVQQDSADGRVDGELSLRARNPLLSLFGRWKLAGRLHVGNAVPIDRNCLYVEGAGARHNDFERHPEWMELLPAEDTERLQKLLKNEIVAAVSEGDDVVSSSAKKKSASRKKNANQNSDDEKGEAIRRPFEGFEAIRAGTAMHHAMRLDCSAMVELGLLLASLREAARRPLVGAHRNVGCGEISGRYDVLSWGKQAEIPHSIGSVQFGFDGFLIEGYELKRALMEWDSKAKNILAHFDFNRYLINEEAE